MKLIMTGAMMIWLQAMPAPAHATSANDVENMMSVLGAASACKIKLPKKFHDIGAHASRQAFGADWKAKSDQLIAKAIRDYKALTTKEQKSVCNEIQKYKNTSL